MKSAGFARTKIRLFMKALFIAAGFSDCCSKKRLLHLISLRFFVPPPKINIKHRFFCVRDRAPARQLFKSSTQNKSHAKRWVKHFENVN